MFKDDLPNMAAQFGIRKFGDCDQVCDPSVKDVLFVLIEGAVAVLDDERMVKRAKTEIRKTRRKKKKAQE